jgi:hypothetical protein
MTGKHGGREPSTVNLLAGTAYAGANASRQLADLMKMIWKLHAPAEGNTACQVVCTTCRDSRGRRVAFPCPEFVRTAEITEVRMDPEDWKDLGVTLPASICTRPKLEEGRQV